MQCGGRDVESGREEMSPAELRAGVTAGFGAAGSCSPESASSGSSSSFKKMEVRLCIKMPYEYKEVDKPGEKRDSFKKKLADAARISADHVHIVAAKDCRTAKKGQDPTSVNVETTVQLDAPKEDCSVVEALISDIRKKFELHADNVTQLCSVCEKPQVTQAGGTLQFCSACKPKADDVTQLCSACKPKADAHTLKGKVMQLDELKKNEQRVGGKAIELVSNGVMTVWKCECESPKFYPQVHERDFPFAERPYRGGWTHKKTDRLPKTFLKEKRFRETVQNLTTARRPATENLSQPRKHATDPIKAAESDNKKQRLQKADPQAENRTSPTQREPDRSVVSSFAHVPGDASPQVLCACCCQP